MIKIKGLNKDLLFKIILVFGGAFFVVFVLRYAIIRNFDAGFSLIISGIVLLLYFLTERMMVYVKIRKKK